MKFSSWQAVWIQLSRRAVFPVLTYAHVPLWGDSRSRYEEGHLAAYGHCSVAYVLPNISETAQAHRGCGCRNTKDAGKWYRPTEHKPLPKTSDASAKKKNGTLRLCPDARKLNEHLVEDHEMSETLNAIFQRFQNVDYLTSLDLTKSFWQVPLTQSSRKYTAFLYRGRCYEYVVTPFGLKTSSASLVRALRRILEGMEGFIVN